MKKRVAVLGGAGFLGSHVVDSLLEADADVVVIDDMSTCRVDEATQFPLHLPAAVEYHASWSSAFAGQYDALINLACRYPVERERAIVRKCWREYVVKFMDLVDMLVDRRACSRVVVGSTLGVYAEKTRKEPFGAVVGSLRQILRYWHRPPTFSVAFAHLPELFGPRQQVSAVDEDGYAPPFSMIGDVKEAAAVLTELALGKARKCPDIAVASRFSMNSVTGAVEHGVKYLLPVPADFTLVQEPKRGEAE